MTTLAEIRTVMRDCGLVIQVRPSITSQVQETHEFERNGHQFVPVGHPRRAAWLAEYFGFDEHEGALLKRLR